jgi:hypothetical protein
VEPALICRPEGSAREICAFLHIFTLFYPFGMDFLPRRHPAVSERLPALPFIPERSTAPLPPFTLTAYLLPLAAFAKTTEDPAT